MAGDTSALFDDIRVSDQLGWEGLGTVSETGCTLFDDVHALTEIPKSEPMSVNVTLPEPEVSAPAAPSVGPSPSRNSDVVHPHRRLHYVHFSGRTKQGEFPNSTATRRPRGESSWTHRAGTLMAGEALPILSILRMPVEKLPPWINHGKIDQSANTPFEVHANDEQAFLVPEGKVAAHLPRRSNCKPLCWKGRDTKSRRRPVKADACADPPSLSLAEGGTQKYNGVPRPRSAGIRFSQKLVDRRKTQAIHPMTPAFSRHGKPMQEAILFAAPLQHTLDFEIACRCLSTLSRERCEGVGQDVEPIALLPADGAGTSSATLIQIAKPGKGCPNFFQEIADAVGHLAVTTGHPKLGNPANSADRCAFRPRQDTALGGILSGNGNKCQGVQNPSDFGCRGVLREVLTDIVFGRSNSGREVVAQRGLMSDDPTHENPSRMAVMFCCVLGKQFGKDLTVAVPVQIGEQAVRPAPDRDVDHANRSAFGQLDPCRFHEVPDRAFRGGRHDGAPAMRLRQGQCEIAAGPADPVPERHQCRDAPRFGTAREFVQREQPVVGLHGRNFKCCPGRVQLPSLLGSP